MWFELEVSKTILLQIISVFILYNFCIIICLYCMCSDNLPLLCFLIMLNFLHDSVCIPPKFPRAAVKRIFFLPSIKLCFPAAKLRHKFDLLQKFKPKQSQKKFNYCGVSVFSDLQWQARNLSKESCAVLSVFVQWCGLTAHADSDFRSGNI